MSIFEHLLLQRAFKFQAEVRKRFCNSGPVRPNAVIGVEPSPMQDLKINVLWLTIDVGGSMNIVEPTSSMENVYIDRRKIREYSEMFYKK